MKTRSETLAAHRARADGHVSGRGRRRHVGLAAALIVAVAAVAVGDARADALTWEFGLKAGFNYAAVTGDNITDHIGSIITEVGTAQGHTDDRRTGFLAAGYGRVGFSERFGAQVEVGLSRKGGKGSVSGRTTPAFGGVEFAGDVTLSLTYVTIPVVAVYTFPVGETVKLSGLAGFELAFATSRDLKLDVVAGATPLGDTVDISDFVSGSDFGGVLGIGVSVPADNVNVIFDVRWTFGFRSIYDGAIPGVDLSIKNNAIALAAGVGFPFSVTRLK